MTAMAAPIFVINLERSQDRKSIMAQRLQELSLPHEFFSATDGRLLTENDRALYDESHVLRRLSRPLSPGEIGCYISHFRLWEKIIAQDLPWSVILEDDVSVADDLPCILSAVNDLALDWDIIRLSGLNSVPLVNLQRIHGEYFLTIPLRGPDGTQGYCISRSGAAKLLSHSNPIPGTVDTHAIDAFLEFGLKVLCVQPYPIVENKALKSIINGDRNTIAETFRLAEKRPRRTIKYRWNKSLNKRLTYLSQLFMALKLKFHLAKHWVGQR